MKRQQRGVSVLGIVLIGVVVAALGVLTARVVPTVIEYRSIQHAVEQAAQASRTPGEARAAFERTRAVGDFDAVTGTDLIITRDNDRLLVEFAYDEEIHLLGPAYLVLKYRGSSH